MNSMDSADKLAFFCFVIAITSFLIKSIIIRLKRTKPQKDNPYEDYLLASKEIQSSDIMMSTAATYSAFATVFFWFITLGGMFSWLLFLIPICLYSGNHFFVRIVKNYDIPLGSQPTISSYIHLRTNHKLLRYITDWVVAIFLFSALLVEVVIGSGIIASMIPTLANGQLIFFILISIFLVSYVVIGGIRSVIKTDVWQFYITSLSAVTLLIFALIYLHPGASATILYPPKVSFSSLLAFIISVIVVQYLAPLCKLSVWHRIATSSNKEEALQAHLKGSGVGAILWAVMIVAAMLLYTGMNEQISFQTIFANMKAMGTITSNIMYPLVFIGLIASMVSTADSAMIGLFLFIYDNLIRSDSSFVPNFRRNIILGVLIFLIMVLVFFINQTDLQGFAITVIYFLFNQLLVVFPVLFFIARDQMLVDKKGLDSLLNRPGYPIEKISFIAIALGWLTVLIMSGIGYYTGVLNWTMYASGAGVTLCAAITFPGCHFLRKAKS